MAADPNRLSFAQFLAWETRQEGKSEFGDGKVLGMLGGTGDHTKGSLRGRTRSGGAGPETNRLCDVDDSAQELHLRGEGASSLR